MRKLFFVFVFLGSLAGSLSAATMHLVIVADLRDDDIAFSTIEDYKRIKVEARTIAHLCDMQLKIYESAYDQFNLMDLWISLDSLKVEADDTIFFYYTGHGFRNEQSWGRMPAILLPEDSETLDLLFIAEYLKTKHARMVLMIADCCNDWSPSWMGPTILSIDWIQDLFSDRGMGKRNRNYRALFRDFHGTVMVSASIPWQTAAGDDHGGYYSRTFWTQLAQEMRRSRLPDWSEFLTLVQKKVLTDLDQDSFFVVEELP